MSGFEADEGILHFRFNEEWKVLKWDDHAAHRCGIAEIDKGKAIDFIGIYGEREVFFIEVKDHRHHDRTNPDPLWNVIESKVRNTVAGLVGGARRKELKEECSPFLDAVCKRRLHLVLWLEAERPHEILDARSKIRHGVKAKQYKPHIKWLNARVITCQLDNYTTVIPGLAVTSLPLDPAKT